MKILVFFLNLLLVGKTISTESEQLHNAGPVVNVMENLADNTEQILDEIYSSLQGKIERNSDTLLGNIQVITANAMEQMAEAFYNANQKLPNCPQKWAMEEILKNLDEQLSNCTSNLYDLRTVFNGENALILQGIQTYVTELANIPAYCELLELTNGSSNSFASSTICFVEKLAELNRNVSQLIGQANSSLIRTRKSARSGVATSTECALKVAQNFTNFLNESFKDC